MNKGKYLLFLLENGIILDYGNKESERKRMNAYTDFATVYDLFMDEVPYDQWLSFLEEIWRKEGLEPQVIADLGCGTGNLLVPLTKKGYRTMGVDLSFDMLCQAEKKLREAGRSSILLEQDLTEVSLPEAADCIISVCDSLNYLTEDGELSAAFACVKASLRQGGLFLFDMNTEYKFREVLAQNTYAVTEENAAYIWENDYDPEEKINAYAVNFFIEGNDGRYERTEEVHYERAYSVEEIKTALSENGFTLLGMYDDYTWESPKEDCQRIVFVAKGAE